LPERVATVVIGNPLIADATLQSGGIVVLTGKGYGETNMLALDRAGKIIMDKTIQVIGPGSGDLVVVYKGVERESYSCAPNCERRITLGDSTTYFNATLAQTGARNGLAAQGQNNGAAR
jgi:Flp pilus assembly secretin CpaC